MNIVATLPEITNPKLFILIVLIIVAVIFILVIFKVNGVKYIKDDTSEVFTSDTIDDDLDDPYYENDWKDIAYHENDYEEDDYNIEFYDDLFE